MDKKAFTLEFLRFLAGGDNVPDYSDLERAARDKQIPMTQSLFEKCLAACAKVGNAAEFFDLFEWFPDCGSVWCDKLDKEWEALDASLQARGIKTKKITADDIQAHWPMWRARMREKYGSEIADSLAEELAMLTE